MLLALLVVVDIDRLWTAAPFPGKSFAYIWRMQAGAGDRAPALIFEALIVPHRSLSRRGLTVLLGAISFLTALMALRSWLIGAWPVLFFSVAEVGLVIFLVRLNVTRARATELLLLDEVSLRVVRTNPHGVRSERVLPAAWLGVVLEQRRGRSPALWLISGREREEVGQSLGEVEKRNLAAALSDALHAWRHPRFDNPQLREK